MESNGTLEDPNWRAQVCQCGNSGGAEVTLSGSFAQVNVEAAAPVLM